MKARRSSDFFFREFLRSPGRVGAIAASSERLAETMVSWIDWDNARTVVEYGPGTGSFTGAIVSRLRDDATFFVVESNPRFVELLRDRYPGLRTYQDSVENIRSICDRESVDRIDAVVCGLPWAAFSDDDQDRFLGTMTDMMELGAQFTTFAYLQGLLLPAGRRFRRLLHTRFSSVETSPVVWRNLPPAFAYRCRK